MILGEALRMAGSNLWSHKMRSILTILGVIIGVGSVLAVVTLGASFEESIVGQFDAIDDRTIFVYSSITPIGEGPPNCMQYCNVWTEVDRDAFAALRGVEQVIEYGDVYTTSLAIDGHELTYDKLTATQPEASELRELGEYASGGPFAADQYEVVLGSSVAEFLSPDRDLEAGENITVRMPDGSAIEAVIAGVLKEDSDFFGDRNGRVFVPVDHFPVPERASPSTGEVGRIYNSFTLVATDARAAGDVRDAATEYALESSDALELKVKDQKLAVSTPSDIQSQISAVFSQVTLFIGAIGGVSLLVGAIGIANIMLVSVTERTREIGVMKAIGAKDSEILLLFLLESVLIGLVGSLLGIALGFAGGAGVVKGVFAGEDIPLVIPYEWLGIAVAVGIGVGVVAGYLPARRATKIQPVKALSYE